MKSKHIAIYPGTFDPITNGHLDILQRATAIFDHVIVGSAEDTTKSTTFSLEERFNLVRTSLKGRSFKCPVSVEVFSGLLVQFAKKRGAKTLVRGLRAISDFEYEFQMALMNRNQAPTIETVFLMPDEKYVYLSSSIIRQLAHLKGRLHGFLPPPVVQAVKGKFKD